MKPFILYLFLLLQTTAFATGPQLSLVVDKNRNAPFEHGLLKLTEVLKSKRISFEEITDLKAVKGTVIIIAGIENSDNINAIRSSSQEHALLQTPEALSTWKTSFQNKPVFVINGYDDRGVMYGLLDMADRIRWNNDQKNLLSNVHEVTEQPAMKERAVSAYTMNRRYWESRFYDEKYWTRYFDMLASDRFNMFTIIFGYENGGFLAPCYPYFFDVDGYPGVKMSSLTKQQQEKNLAAINRIIQLAHERGIGITLGIWDHIYRGGIQSGNSTGGPDPLQSSYVQVTGLDSSNLISYTKAALNKLINVLPGLDVIQFRMHDESGLKKDEQRPFWRDVFQSMKENHPAMRLVLRAKGLPDEIIQDAINSGVHFSIATKFWMEQAGLPYSPTHVNKQDQLNRRHGYADLLRYPQQYKMIWRLWTGGTNRILLWGDPRYASRFIQSLDIYGEGSYGFDVNEMLATKMESQPHDEAPFDLLNPFYRYYDYEFERYWDFYLCYGRMGYNPQTPAEIWTNTYKQHFGKTGPLLEKAMHAASKILPRIVASCYNYSFFPTTRGWAEKQPLGDLAVYAKAQGSDVQQFESFDEEAQRLIEGGETGKVLPSMTSLSLELMSAQVDYYISAALKGNGSKRSREFNSTIVDLKILSGLALFHSRRIPAAVYYCLYMRTHDPAAMDSAIVHERNAIAAWQQVVKAAGDVYASDLKFGLSHTGFEGVKFELAGHWKDELINLQKDLADLQKQMEATKTQRPLKPAPAYKPATDPYNSGYFSIAHERVLTAPVGKPVTITVKIDASKPATAGIKWVRLQYRSVNQYLDFTTLPMQATGEKDVYTATIPADKIDPRWDLMYLIEMMDTNGHGFIYPNFNEETPYVVTKLSR